VRLSDRRSENGEHRETPEYERDIARPHVVPIVGRQSLQVGLIPAERLGFNVSLGRYFQFRQSLARGLREDYGDRIHNRLNTVTPSVHLRGRG